MISRPSFVRSWSIRRLLLFGLVALGSAIASSLVLPAAPISQAIAFNHAKHAPLGCAGCHSGVLTRERAGFPSGALCGRCHATPPATIATADWQRLQTEGAGFWRPVTRIPDHVMFSHRRHVALGGLACASCHADIGQRPVPPSRPPVRLVMKTCLGCHRTEGISEDCAACHR